MRPVAVPLAEFLEDHHVFVLDGREYSSDDEDLLIVDDPKYNPVLRLPYTFVRFVEDVAVQEPGVGRERVVHKREPDFELWESRPRRTTWEGAVVALRSMTYGLVDNKIAAGWRMGQYSESVITFANDYPDLVVNRTDRLTMLGPRVLAVGDYRVL